MTKIEFKKSLKELDITAKKMASIMGLSPETITKWNRQVPQYAELTVTLLLNMNGGDRAKFLYEWLEYKDKI